MIKYCSGFIAASGSFPAIFVMVFVIALGGTLPGLAQQVSILDLNTTGVLSNTYVYLDPDQPTLDSRLFFRAESDDGDELWVTDGTAGGTSVEDLATGAGSSIPDVFTAVGNRIFFSAVIPGLGRELWTTTGPDQASLVADLEAGAGDSVPRALTALDDMLFFTAEVAGSRTLYTVDSLTMAVNEVAWGVVKVDFNTEMVEDNSRVYFKGTPWSGGVEEIWASDGTTAGTEQATNLGCPAWGELLGVGTSVFVVCDFGSSTELLRLDPVSASGVSLVRRFGDQVVNHLTPSGGNLYMNVGDDEIWAYSNGSGAVFQVTSFGGNALPRDLTRYQGDLMFTASGDAGRELYRTDGATVTEIDIRPGGSSSDPKQIQIHDGKLFFTAADGSHGRELWMSDGTVGGTEMVVDLEPGTASSSITIGPSTEFGLAFKLGYYDLWITDGTAGGTVEIPFPQSFATDPTELLLDQVRDRLFFVGHRGPRGAEPFVTDGTAAGTFSLGDIEPGPEGSAAWFQATLPNGRTLFTAERDPDGRQLWSTEGHANDAMLTKVIDPTGLGVLRGVIFNDHYYFCADDGIHGSELWRSDGTTVGTELVVDLNPSGRSAPCDLAVFQDHLYFGAEDTASSGLWKTDGTAAGTVLVAVTGPTGYPAPWGLTVFDGHLYFTADDGVVGEELWRSDGTPGGTSLLVDIYPGLDSSSPSSLHTAGGLLYFVAEDPTTGRELWRTDGSPSGTVQIADIDPSGDSRPVPFAEINGGLVFKASSAGDHLYFTDGSPGSLTLLLSGYVPTWGNNHAMWNGHLYFAAGDLGSGSSDLWRTDGTVAGTENLQLEPLGTGSNPSYLAAGPDRLYLSAYDATTKREIHLLEFPLFADGFESGNTSAW